MNIFVTRFSQKNNENDVLTSSELKHLRSFDIIKGQLNSLMAIFLYCRKPLKEVIYLRITYPGNVLCQQTMHALLFRVQIQSMPCQKVCQLFFSLNFKFNMAFWLTKNLFAFYAKYEINMGLEM